MPKEIRALRADLAPMVAALPTEDRQRSFNFYAEGLGLEPIGEAAEDGIPEPLQFVLNQGVRLMLVPTRGFGWVTGTRPTAGRGASECLLVLTVADEGTGIRMTHLLRAVAQDLRKQGRLTLEADFAGITPGAKASAD